MPANNRWGLNKIRKIVPGAIGAFGLMPFVAAAQNSDISAMVDLAQIAITLLLVCLVAGLWLKLRGKRNPAYAYLYRLKGRRLVKHSITTDVVRIGRHPNNELRLNDKSISRFHAEIVRNPNGTFSIHDADSKNGIRVGFRPVNSTLLREGDLIDVGGIRMKFTRYPRDYNVHRNTVMLDLPPTRYDTQRRRGERQDVAMSVRIYNDESGWINGRVRDLGPDGAFIETDRHLTPRVPVDMVFPVVDGDRRKWLRLAAEVVREGPDGVGIAFTDNDPSTINIISHVSVAA